MIDFTSKQENSPCGPVRVALVATALGSAFSLFAQSPSPPKWSQLPPLPDRCGFASPFVGVVDGTLLLAGGANFPEQQLWEGGRKTWHDRIFVLKPDAAQWSAVGKLPGPRGYGLSISTDQGLLCAGGSDSAKHYATVFLLRLTTEGATVKSLPPLPRTIAMGTGARIGNIVYLACGQETPESAEPLNTFYSFDLSRPSAGWKTLPPLPGPGRIQAVAAVAGEYFYLFSGIRPVPKPGGGQDRIYLKDCYRYSPQEGWQKLADLPHAAGAAASPAPTLGNKQVLLVGGVDGTIGDTPYYEFPQVPQRIQAYSIQNNSWSAAPNAPVGRVCVSTTEWNGRWVLPCGERSPGIRSPEVWSVVLE